MDKLINVGQVVKSKAGRDRGDVFIVSEVIDDEYVLIVNGKSRKIENPKKKKIKHLIIYHTILPEYCERIESKVSINNANVRTLLENF